MMNFEVDGVQYTVVDDFFSVWKYAVLGFSKCKGEWMRVTNVNKVKDTKEKVENFIKIMKKD